MRKLRLLTLFALITFFCNAQTVEELRLDATSEGSLERTTQSIRSSLDETTGNKFLISIMFIGNYVDNEYKTDDEKQVALKKILDKKNYEEVIKLGKEFAEKNKIRKKEKSKQELSVLYSKLKEANKQKEVLAKIEISNFRVSKKVNKFNQEIPVVNFTFKNSIEEKLYQIHFLVYNPQDSTGRQNIKLFYNNNEGVNIGEEVEYGEEKSTYAGDLNKLLDNKSGLKIVVVRVLDSENITKYSQTHFSEYDKREMEKILRKYPDLE